MAEKILVIVESPAKAKTIGRFLGRNYLVKSSMGHVRDLPRSQFGVDVDNSFEPKYITIRGKGDIVKELRDAAKKSGKILLASDPDREGEAIAWHLKNLLDIDDAKPCRIEFHEITEPAITQAIRNPRPIDYHLVDAQQARRVLDRLVGYKLSPLLWRKIRKGLSAGRVQSVAVRLICEREDEINSFKPEEYWSLAAVLRNADDQNLEAKLIKKDGKKAAIPNQETIDRIIESLQGAAFLIQKVSRKERKRQPPAPFITSSLQQEAARRLNFTAKRTMAAAQQLYEGISLGDAGPVGLITYLRTDSTRVSALAQASAREFISSRYGKPYLPSKPREYKKAGQAQDAHEAIRPSGIEREPDSIKAFLKPDQYKLYRLIWQRFLASQMSNAVFEVASVDISAGNCLFRATGQVLRFPGFMAVYREEEEEDLLLPQLEEGSTLQLVKLDPKQHFTQPPPRYTEASLIKTLEEKGIGRPSTYAPTIETILSRNYIKRESRQFVPTELGQVVVNLLKDYFPDVVDVEFTAQLESKLDQIEEGGLEWRRVIGEFYAPFSNVLARAEKEIGTIEVADEISDEVCPKCGRQMVIKTGRYGRFLACPGFPECRSTKAIQTEIGVSCPRCGGKVVLRHGKKGRLFYGCGSYPECDYTSFNRPSSVDCPSCGERLVEKGGRRSTKLVCPQCKHEEGVSGS